MKSYSDFGINIPYGRTSGKVKTYCPKCHDQRHARRDKSLSVDLDKGLWNCPYCGWGGSLETKEPWEREERPWHNYAPIKRQKPVYKKPPQHALTAVSERALKWFE